MSESLIMRRFTIATTAAIGVFLTAAAQAEGLYLEAPLPPNLHSVSPWTPSTVRLTQDLAMLEQYQVALQQFHAWLDSQVERGHR